MGFLILLLVSLLPGLAWVWFFHRQDRFDKEPARLVLWTFLAGMVAVVPAALIEFPFRELIRNPPSLAVRFVCALVVIGLVEEGVKLLAVYAAAFRRAEFNEAVDGIIYAVTGSLGFAALENLFYVSTFGLGVAPVRAVVTSLAHASFGGVAGLYLGLAKCREGSNFADVLKGLGIAAFLHGVYDFFIMTGLVHPLFALALIYATYRYIAAQIRALGEASPFRRL